MSLGIIIGMMNGTQVRVQREGICLLAVHSGSAPKWSLMKAWKPFARGGRAPGFFLGGRRNQVSRREEGVPFQKVACLGCFFSRVGEKMGVCVLLCH